MPLRLPIATIRTQVTVPLRFALLARGADSPVEPLRRQIGLQGAESPWGWPGVTAASSAPKMQPRQRPYAAGK
jgi:hypothetical protein